MTDQDNHAALQGHQPHRHEKKPVKQLSGEDKVVICFSLLGLIGSVALYFLKVPSVMISIFLSAGITALVYRFLGGIQNATFAVGALKLGGTIAALIGIAFWVDDRLDSNREYLDSQRNEWEAHRFHLVSDDVMVGEWEWEVIGPSSSWDGHLDFVKAGSQLTFSGKEYNVEKVPEGTKRTLILEMTNGKAALINGASLTLESEVQDRQYGRKFHWKSVAPFPLIPTFRGQLRPEKPDDPNLESSPWGMMIYKKAAKPGD
jgi:hypothetical protein